MRILFSKDRLLNSKNEYLQNCISRITVSEEVWERKERERKEEEEETLEIEKLAKFRKLKQSSSHVSSPQEDPAEQPSSPLVEPATEITTTLEKSASTMCPGKQDELFSPPNIQTASLPAKRKEQTTSDSLVSKRLKPKVKQKEQQLLDMNISKW